MATQPLPLTGVRVVDYSHFLAGPFLSRCLAAMGAEVIKVERPKAGDAGRAHAMFVARAGRGLNITAPCKLDAFAYADDLRDRAKLAGAVNAMKFDGDRVIADNFDGVGLVNDITRNLDRPMKGRRLLLLGAGGTVRGAILPLLAQEPAEFVIANRTVAKALALARQFAPYGSFAAVGYDALADRGAFDIVVNGTSASLHGELPPVSFKPDGLAYELAYGKGLTPFLRAAPASPWSPTASACLSSRPPKRLHGRVARGRRPGR
nr:CoA transferase [uncultured Rhodopila sp.]